MFDYTHLETLEEIIPVHLEDCLARGLSPATVTRKKSSLGFFQRWCLAHGIYLAKQLQLEHLEGYRRFLHLYRQVKNNEPLALSTQRLHLTDIKVFLRRLYYFRIIERGRFEELELPSVPRSLPEHILTVEDIEKVLAQTVLFGDKGIRDRAMMETFYATGIRRMELANLCIDNVDFKKGLIFVKKGKGGRDRYTPIAQRACVWIVRYLNESRPKLATFESGNSLFLADSGKPIPVGRLTAIVSRYINRSGINKTGSCNLFRHATATLMLDAGADLRIIQEMLGHADISTTQIYTFVSREKLLKVYRKTHPASFNEEKLLEAS